MSESGSPLCRPNFEGTCKRLVFPFGRAMSRVSGHGTWMRSVSSIRKRRIFREVEEKLFLSCRAAAVEGWITARNGGEESVSA
jgi:hypothetical protein